MLAIARAAISSSTGMAARICGVTGTLNGGPIRSLHVPNIVKPEPGTGKSYRRIVHKPIKYTIEPLNVTNLAGRDPVSGTIKFIFITIKTAPIESPIQYNLSYIIQNHSKLL